MTNILLLRYWWKHIWYWIGDMLLVLIFCQLRHQHLSGVWTLTRTTQASPTEDQHWQCLHINQLHPTTRKKTKTTIKTMTVTKTITMTAKYLEPTFLFNDKQNLEPSYTVRCNWQRKHIFWLILFGCYMMYFVLV